MDSLFKWQGGKTKLLPYIRDLAPLLYQFYFEPFLGSGTLFLKEEPNNAILSDIQSEPIILFNAIKNTPDDFYNTFKTEADKLYKEGSDYYYSLRDKFNNKVYYSDAELAGMFLVLLYSGYNGLVRFNSKGHWNVPYGDRGSELSKTKNNIKTIFPYHKIQEYSFFLNQHNSVFENKSFEEMIPRSDKYDFIYVDPPYLNTQGKYSTWTEKDENNLFELLMQADKRKVKFLLSNVYFYKGKKNDWLLEMYKGFHYKLIDYNYIINQKVEQKECQEILIYNYDK
jgi:DNA adenine methylase